MTPVNFVAFLVSLILIDLRYTILRSQTHSHSPSFGSGSRLPSWLCALVHREQPYDYRNGQGRVHVRVRDEKDNRSTSNSKDSTGDGPPWHYHTKQKQIIKMEAEEAFRFRNTLLVGLGVGIIVILVSIWSMSSRVYRFWVSLLIGSS